MIFQIFHHRGDPCDLGGKILHQPLNVVENFKRKTVSESARQNKHKNGWQKLLTNFGFIGSPLLYRRAALGDKHNMEDLLITNFMLDMTCGT